MTAQARTRPPAGPDSLTRNRDFRLLWVGQGVSELGSSMTEVVLPLLLLSLGYQTSVVGALGTVILVVGLLTQMPAGYLADRFDQRRIMLCCDLIRAGATAVLTVCAFTGTLPLPVVLAVVVVSHAGSAAFRPAQGRALRRIVPREQIMQAVSINQARGYGIGILGPALGGALFTVGHVLPMAVDTVTFLASAACILALRIRPRTEHPAGAPLRLLPAIGAGWRYLLRDRFLRWSTLYFALINVAFSALTYLLILGVGSRPGGGLTVGAAITIATGAGLVGSLLAPRLQRHLRLRPMLLIAPVLTAALLVLAARGNAVVLLIVSFVALCFYSPICGAMIMSIQMLIVPEHLYGRVMSTVGFIAQSLQPLAPLGAGLLLGHLPLSVVLAVMAAAFAVIALAAIAIPTPVLPEPTAKPPEPAANPPEPTAKPPEPTANPPEPTANPPGAAG